MAAPLLALIIGLELLLSAIFAPKHSDTKDTFANIAVGLLALGVSVFAKSVALGFFLLCEQVALFDIQRSWWAWTICLIGSDFVYYWFHRSGHKVRIMWAGHVTHHSSHQFNFSVAVRIPIFQQFYRFLFYGPIALLGFDAWMIITCDSIVSLYQFWLHTEHIGKLGFIENIFVTPSHHRVHHGCNGSYLDRNYGGMLIIWDRLLGTYKEEDEKPVYGITQPLRTYNPFIISFHELVDMVRDVWKAKTLREGFMRVFGRPGWREESALRTGKERALESAA